MHGLSETPVAESKAACGPWIRNQLRAIMTNEAQGLAYGSRHEQISLLFKRPLGPFSGLNEWLCVYERLLCGDR